MKKWAISAFVYLLVVVSGYYVYASVAEPDSHEKKEDIHDETTVVHGQDEENSHGQEHQENGDSHSGESEVTPSLQDVNGELIITLKDIEGKPVSDLEVNHEKLLHLIVVSTDLKEYQHLHPQTNEPGVFKISHSLRTGEYKAFVDIKPKGKVYKVEPITFKVGEKHIEHNEGSLMVDSELTKEAGGHKVSLLPSSLKTNEEIQLTFDLGGETPEQYLGALGHVVILDEKGENYIHVHPLEGNEPVFATKFSDPGVYKIWAEFKFNGEVFVYPYVVEIK
ncbi:hypothetical protein V7087_03380 [Neobacillus niacini]|uniref:hypothetical protein n=1 Tax=Neobacillus niacini TaxID=86668 RepID=UPI002FFD5C19